MKFTIRDAHSAVEQMHMNLINYNFGLSELTRGMNIELEHGSINNLTNITNDDLILTAKIALAHLLEDPNYYIKLKKIEGNGTQIQSVIFNKKYYTKEKAEKFLIKNMLHPIKPVHETENFLRYRQAKPNIKKKYYTVKIKNGVKFIMMQ